MDPVLIISGPTASGKTSLALSLAKKFNGDLISADSRQVYKGLDIVTGKDIPEGFNFYHDQPHACHPERNEMKSRDPSSQKGFLRYGRNDIKPIPHYDVLHLNLNISLERLEPKIRARVIARLAADPRDELKYLKSFHLSDRHPAFTSLGYHHLDRFYQGKITRDQLIDLWTTAERQYAKRQLTWFNKLEHLTRLKTPVDTSEVVRLIKLWYSQGKYGKK